MVQFGDITSKTIRVDYTKMDIEGYKITGSATYNKENQLTEANGSIADEERNIGSFNIYNIGGDTRINLSCSAKLTDVVNDIAKATLADLANGYAE